ncbi:tyrosine-type recombinase/integrase [Nitriliruptor alkaliphilus]|uniref:tyrosine-type recombinase/integrase n=1 Tax=Nitriliruptor alkaliphilus TaxID=427918 RepID=UPI000697DE7D|nr:site-specific integrase [Nitriliruptor alkaliphilus]
MTSSARWRGRTQVVDDRIDDLLIRLGSGGVESDETVDEYFIKWLETRRPSLAATTHGSYVAQYRYYISPHLGRVPLNRVTSASVAAWLNTLLTSGGRRGGSLSAATVRYSRILLHKAFEDAVATGALLVNPVSRVQAPQRDVNGLRRRYPASSWSVEELRTFLHQIDGHQFAPLFTLLSTTGMRRSEALALSWSDVDFKRREVSISKSLAVRDGQPVRGSPKRARSRRIALGEHGADALEDQLDRQQSSRARASSSWSNELDLVFTSPDGSFIPPSRATDRFRVTVARLPLSRIRLHDLRHTHAILLLQAGMPVIDVSQRLGHATPAVTLELYAQALQNPGHALAETFDQLLENRLWASNDLADARRRDWG